MKKRPELAVRDSLDTGLEGKGLKETGDMHQG
jgi:hypothetical protein